MLDAGSDVSSNVNSYALLAKLATGGMADIFLARTESAAGVERYVVLKQILSERAHDITFVHMFLDEARLAAQLQHPNVAQVYDTGKLNNSYFFTMEYVHGETVRDLLRRAYEHDQKIPLGVALAIVAGAAAGLQHAHERTGHDGQPLGIVHRDVSPSNLMISYEGNVKIVDFGVAKAAHRSVETVAGTIKGKIGYMAPVQCRGHIVDPRGVLFSVGFVLWELLVGDRLYKRDSDYETMMAIDTEPPPPPSSRRPDVPWQIDALVLKLLAKAPADRFQSAAEVLEALENTAAATAMVMSMSSVRRFMLEMFGLRPEPWLSIRAKAEPLESVTVTGAPLLSRSPTVDAGEVRLDQLLDLRTPPRASASFQGQVAPGLEPESAIDTPRVRPRWPFVAVGVIVVSLAVIAFSVFERDEPAVSADVRPIATTRDVAVVASAADAGTVPADAPVTVDTAVAVAAITPADVLKTASREGRYADALAACVGTKSLPATHAAMCTLAACHERAEETAKRWAHAIARGERGPVVEACRSFGVTLPKGGSRPSSKTEKCADPMECRK